MTILIASDDEDAARSLCSALTRSGQGAHWSRSVLEGAAYAREKLPLVLVADTALLDHVELIETIRELTPWARIYLMADPAGLNSRAGAPVVPKPFDAAQLAELLARESELAELERGRRSLQAHADELALLIEASFEALIGLGRDGTILSWNKGAEGIYGYRADEAIGKSVSLLETDDDTVLERFSGEHRIAEVERRTKDGGVILVLMSLSAIPDQHGTPLAFAEVSLDVTDRKRLERELEHSERLAGIGRLAASMAHEINNPLAVIRATTSYIAEVADRLGDQDLAESAEDMELAVERIGSFVQHVCGFARRERPQLEDTPVAATIEIAHRMVRARAKERGVTLRVEKMPSTRVPHDPPRLAQAVVNVVANAIDAAAIAGGEVSISLQTTDSHVEILVLDDGPGVPAELLSEIFEPFMTTKPHGQGTGLGLAITHQILQDHGGKVTLEPRSPAGTLARLAVPLLDVAAQLVVVLDADPSVRRALATELKRERFQVLTVASREEALDTVKKRKVAVAILDYAALDEQPSGACDLIAEISPNTRCLLITSSIAEVHSHVHAVIEKPWDRRLLVDTVRQLCVRHSSHD